MSAPNDPNRPENSARPSRSASELVSNVIQHGSTLFRREIDLAKTELSQKATQLKAAIGELIAGTVLLIVSLGILLSALVSGLARLLVGIFGGDPTASLDIITTEGLDEGQAQLLAAMNQSVEAVNDAARTLPTYEGLAALLVGLTFAIIGGVLLRNGLSKLDPESLVPDRTVRQVKKDGDTVCNDI